MTSAESVERGGTARFELQPTLRGELVTLRPMRREDFDALFEAAKDPLIWEQHPEHDRHSEAKFRRYFQGGIDSGGALVVIDNETERMIGSTRFCGYASERSEIEIGWTFLERKYWGGQVNGEMKRLMLDHAFRFVEHVVFLIGEDNWRSRRAVEKIGAVRVENRIDEKGADRVVYRITRSSRAAIPPRLPAWIVAILGAAAVFGGLLSGPVARAMSVPAIPDGISSPRLQRLQSTVARGDTSAISGFWSEVQKQGTPLVEPGASSDERLVTFLWRSTPDTRVFVMTDFADFVPHMTLERMPHTDVWFRSLRLPHDSRFFYELSVDDPAYPFVDGDTVEYPSSTRPDPLNPRQYDFTKPQVFSVVELPGAPSLALSEKKDDVRHCVVGRFETKLKSKILNNERDVFVYQPVGYSDKTAPYPLLIFGASYINQIRMPVILDHLIAQKRIPPVVAVLVGFPPSPPGQNMQDEEAGGGEAFGNFVAQELLPWVRKQVHVTTDPKQVVIGGASAGGHSAAFVALQHPEAIGNVIAQSGAFWRGVGHTARYWGEAGRDEGREGFARAVATRPGPAAPVRFYLTIGRLERGRALENELVTMLHATRHVRDVLEAKGYDVTLREINAGHDPYNWEATLPEALAALLGSSSRSVAGKR